MTTTIEHLKLMHTLCASVSASAKGYTDPFGMKRGDGDYVAGIVDRVDGKCVAEMKKGGVEAVELKTNVLDDLRAEDIDTYLHEILALMYYAPDVFERDGVLCEDMIGACHFWESSETSDREAYFEYLLAKED